MRERVALLAALFTASPTTTAGTWSAPSCPGGPGMEAPDRRDCPDPHDRVVIVDDQEMIRVGSG